MASFSASVLPRTPSHHGDVPSEAEPRPHADEAAQPRHLRATHSGDHPSSDSPVAKPNPDAGEGHNALQRVAAVARSAQLSAPSTLQEASRRQATHSAPSFS